MDLRIGDLGFSLTNTILNVYLALFLTDVVGVAPAVAAAAFFVGSTWDYINDPIIGYISDRTRSAGVAAGPFLLFGALPFAAAFCLLWWRPPFDSSLALGIYYAAAFALLRHGGDIRVHAVLRADAGADGRLRRTDGADIHAHVLFDSREPAGLHRPPLDRRELSTGSCWPGPAHGSDLRQWWLPCRCCSFFERRERPEFMRAKPSAGLRQSMRLTWRNRPFIFGLGMFLFNGVTMSILQVVLLYYIKYVVLHEAQSDTIMATIFVVAMMALPLWEWISRRLNKRLAYIVGVCVPGSRAAGACRR